MSDIQTASELSDQDFDAIKTAVMETERGRKFLDEFAKQHRVAETQTLLDAIARLEDNINTHKKAPIDLSNDLDDLAQAISATSDDICSVRNDMVEDGCELSDRQQIFSSLSADAAEIAGALISAAEALQAAVTGMREDVGPGVNVDIIDENVGKLFENGWRQDVLAQRITKAMRLLTHLQVSLEAFGTAPVPADAGGDIAHNEDSKQYFAADEALFNAEAEEEPDNTDPVDEPHDGTPSENIADAAAPDTAQTSASQDDDPETQPSVEIEEIECAAISEGDGEIEDGNHDEASQQMHAEADPKIVVVRAGASEHHEKAGEDIEAAHRDDTGSDDAGLTTRDQANGDTPTVSDDEKASPALPAETEEADVEELPANMTSAGNGADNSIDAEDNAGDAPTASSDNDSNTRPEVEAASEIFEAFGDFASATPTLVSHPELAQPEMTVTDEEKQRIVVIRRSASEEKSIPFADYLGLDDSADASKSQ